MKIIEIIYSLSSGGAERFVVDLSNEFVAKGIRQEEIRTHTASAASRTASARKRTKFRLPARAPLA